MIYARMSAVDGVPQAGINVVINSFGVGNEAIVCLKSVTDHSVEFEEITEAEYSAALDSYGLVIQPQTQVNELQEVMQEALDFVLMGGV